MRIFDKSSLDFKRLSTQPKLLKKYFFKRKEVIQMTAVTSNQLQIESIKKQVTAEYQEHLKSLENNSIRYSPDNENDFFNQSLKLVVFTELKTILTNTNVLDNVDEYSLNTLQDLNISESFWWVWLRQGGTYIDLSEENVTYLLNKFF